MPVFKSTRLLDQIREQIRYLHYSLRTEEAYVYWVKNFIRFHGLKHPRDMGQAEIESGWVYSPPLGAFPFAAKRSKPYGIRVSDTPQLAAGIFIRF